MSCRIDQLLLQAAEMNASDLHISEGGPIIVRVAGALAKPGGVLPDVFSLFEPILPEKQCTALKIKANVISLMRFLPDTVSVSTYTAAWKGWTLLSGLFPTVFPLAMDWDCRKRCGNFQS